MRGKILNLVKDFEQCHNAVKDFKHCHNARICTEVKPWQTE
jgi:hypothetical protein